MGTARAACGLIVAVVLLSGSAPASADDGTVSGGASAPQPPHVHAVRCDSGTAWACAPGRSLTVRGHQLRDVATVIFTGAPGRRDDRRVTPRVRAAHSLQVGVPVGARTGPLVFSSRHGDDVRTARRLRVGAAPAPAPAATTPPASALPGDAGGALFVLGPQPASLNFRAANTDPVGVEAARLNDGVVVRRWSVRPAADGSGTVSWDGMADGKPALAGRYVLRIANDSVARASVEAGGGQPFVLLDHIFPIRAQHDLGQSPANNFGGGRGHQGQDMFAQCGAPLVAAHGGEVLTATYQARAGNYIVIRRPDGQSYAYMHMRNPALVAKGDRVFTGQPIGYVGDTGAAQGCHLHLEIWSSPGWYAGGRPFDPLPELKRWDAMS